jgi:hypothetical protein
MTAVWLGLGWLAIGAVVSVIVGQAMGRRDDDC